MTQNYSHNSKAECCPKTHTDTHTHLDFRIYTDFKCEEKTNEQKTFVDRQTHPTVPLLCGGRETHITYQWQIID